LVIILPTKSEDAESKAPGLPEVDIINDGNNEVGRSRVRTAVN
jgi:hypothetical protein